MLVVAKRVRSELNAPISPGDSAYLVSRSQHLRIETWSELLETFF